MSGDRIFNPGGVVVVSLAVGGGYSYNNNQISFTTTGTATMSGAGSGTSLVTYSPFRAALLPIQQHQGPIRLILQNLAGPMIPGTGR